MKENNPSPPRYAEKFLEWFIRDDLAEEVLGDLEEKFFHTLDTRSYRKARINYWYQVFNYLRPFAVRRKNSLPSNQYAMFKNYYTVAWRNLLKHKMYSFIKIGGFALGIAACLLISLYIQDELSYDKQYADGDRVYRLLNSDSEDLNIAKWPAFQAPIKEVLNNDFPEIEMSGRLIPYDWYDAGSNQVKRENSPINIFEKGFVYGDPELLEILEINMIAGDRTNALDDPNSIVITERKAEKLFPGKDAMGQTLVLNDNKENPYKITGVIQDRPTNSHLQFDYMITLSGVEFWNGEQASWCCSNYNPYIRLKPGTDLAAFDDKLEIIRDNYLVPYLRAQKDAGADDTEKNRGIELQAIGDIHLDSKGIYDNFAHGDIRIVWIFGTIALFVLLLACINFINLSTAKSANRAREVGLRKVIGSQRKNIINQFLTESVLFSFISFILGVLMAELLLPYFNMLADKGISFPWADWWFVPLLAGGALLIGVLAGVYPSFYLSSFKPVDVLKGSLSRGSKGSILQSSMVIFQFTTSIILIIGAVVVNRQMDYILNSEIGFDKDQVVLLQGTNTIPGEKFKQLQNELKRIPEVENVTASNYLPILGTKRDQNGFWNEGMVETEKSIGAQIWFVGNDYINTLGMNLIAGRDFDESIASDSSAIIINETMVKDFGFEDPIGKRITNNYMPTFTVIGVVEDFHFSSVKEEILPLSMVQGNFGENMPIKIKGANIPATLTEINEIWDEFAPNQPMRYTFLDQSFAMMYDDVERTGRIFTIFATLAIIVACLGLFALSAFMVEQRRKEISIRKVLGASTATLFNLLTADFLKLIAISLFIAIPLGYYAMREWLEDYASPIDLTWDIFVIAGLITLSIALLTISFESLKLVRLNPAGSLRSE